MLEHGGDELGAWGFERVELERVVEGIVSPINAPVNNDEQVESEEEI